MQRRKPGRPSRGEREPLYVKMPVHLLETLRFHAAGRGMTVTDLVGETLARELGIPYMKQETLPLTSSKAS